MRKERVSAIVIKGLALLVLLGTANQVMAQGATTPYPNMAPIKQYLMDRTAEAALARSAAPDAISRDAMVLVLGRRGYETAVEGKNGWVCMVERGWMAPFDHPDFWNPKIRAANCLNPPAARSILPFALKRTELVLAHHSKGEVIDAIQAELDKKELPALEPGAMAYMMGKGSYLFDEGDHNGPHLMFYDAVKNDATWGANMPNSPIVSVNYWCLTDRASRQFESFPPIRVFAVPVGKWSDGTPAPKSMKTN